MHLLNTCWSLLASSEWEVRLSHCYREGNKVADRLANIGVLQEVHVVFFAAPPPEITTLLHEDIMGVTTPRFLV